METTQTGTQEHGTRILNAVERLLEPSDVLLGKVKRWREAKGENTEAVAAEAIREYSNLSALAGGVTALPALVPGVGTAAALLTGPLADVIVLLKLETELGLCLSAIHGFDIKTPEQRQLVFLLASLKVSEAKGDQPLMLDATEITATAIWKYTPREVSKILVMTLSALAVGFAGRGLVRTVPLLGIFAGAGMNKLLTQRAGERMHGTLRTRRALLSTAVQA